MFDLDGYFLRKLDITQGYKPLDFGGGGITGSVNRDGRIIAVNNYHPEHGYVTLTSIPAFPDEDRYDAQKVRAYRRSLVDNEGFGLAFEQEIVEREYYLIEDAVPFMRFTLADGTVAECLTIGDDYNVRQLWTFSTEDIVASVMGTIWLQRAAYTQLTEGGVVQMPSPKTVIFDTFTVQENPFTLIDNSAINYRAALSLTDVVEIDNGVRLQEKLTKASTYIFSISMGEQTFGNDNPQKWINDQLKRIVGMELRRENTIVSRAINYGYLCTIPSKEVHGGNCMITDHMILPLSWNRDSYYVASLLMQVPYSLRFDSWYHIEWLLRDAWRGTYYRNGNKPISYAWGRAYMANGRAKDNNAYQLDQQIFPLLELCEWLKHKEHPQNSQMAEDGIFRGVSAIIGSEAGNRTYYSGLFGTDETPADDDLGYPFHFSSHVLLWHTARQVRRYAADIGRVIEILDSAMVFNANELHDLIQQHFIQEHNGRKIYAYAIGESGNYFYHDANDIPLVMMPIWGFCDKDDPVWRNTVEFAFSDENPGFYDGVLGSVHTPAPWALGDAQELILCKVIGDRDRYARVWERVEKAAQWDGALPEAYDANTFEVVSRHWFAWPNAMIAIADSISWDWEAELQKEQS